jgi:molybdopterin/thiamine biosynthesis adenylyltransferase
MEVEKNYYTEAFSRNIGILTEKDQAELQKATVAVAGMGGVGGVYATALARSGIGTISMADFDVFSVVNTNRQAGAMHSTMGQSKAEVMERMVKDINPTIVVHRYDQGVVESTAEQFMSGAKVVLDGIDFFNVKARLLLYRTARKHGAYVIAAAPIGFGSSLLVFSPTGMTFEDYFGITDEMSEEEMELSFALGLSPSLLQRSYYKPSVVNFADKRAPSLGISTLLCANLAVCEVIKILIGTPVRVIPFSSQFDPYVQGYKQVTLWGGYRHPFQRFKRWYFKRMLRKVGTFR